MLEEKFKMSVGSVIADFSKQGLTIGTQFYILKDIVNEVSVMYNQFLQQELEKEKEKTSEEEEEE